MWPLNGKSRHNCCIELGTKYLLKMFHLFNIYPYRSTSFLSVDTKGMYQQRGPCMY